MLCLFLLTVSAQEYPLVTNRVTWNGNTGIKNGIPARSTIYQSFTSSATAGQINTAIANCPSNQVVYLAAGTYSLGQLDFGAKKGVTLRGAGQGQTIINSTASGSACIIGDQYSFGGTPAALSSGYTQGSTAVVFSSSPSAEFAVDRLISISSLDDTNFVFASGGPDRNMQSTHKITSVSGTTVNFEPPLPFTLQSGKSPQAEYMVSGPGMQMCSVEDMTINNNGGADIIIYWWGADSCWIEDVELVGPVDSGVWLVDSYRCEMRKSFIRDAANFPNNGDGYGIMLFGSTGSSGWHLVEDNAFENLFVAIWGKRWSCTAILNNFATNSVGQGFTHQRGIFNAGHGEHAWFNLWEGNVGEQWQHDAYHGSASHQVVFRNWIHGLNALYDDNRKMIDLGRGTYWCSIIGNVLGDASWTPDQFKMSGQPSYDVGNVIYRFGYPNMASNGTDPEDVASPWTGYGTWTYPDALTEPRTFLHGNYDHSTDSQIWDADVADHTIANSLYYSSKPDYFASLSWLAYDPANPSAASPDDIPAGYRFINGDDPPEEGGGGSSGGGTVNVNALRIGTIQVSP